ncbi:hypothetical protein CPB84DRAFT_1216899 [Gymnopilus junonius]|uniref:Uncharacterized protein n=1 Tax=Gymnopilus junonius TaxID=109634 RepID=A0A9P5NXU1_GYMJU|nr:hypothetical protein CPB84DRAFT_1216899 [Gymnopilus junonius]
MCDFWHRIQVLAIVLTLDILPVVPPELFYMPAPRLEVFRVMVSKGDERDYSGIFNLWPTKPLFANDAPFLRVFNPPLSLHFDISHADWLRNLSTMYLGPPFVVQEIISILQRTPRLETLRIERISIKPDVKSSPPPGDIRLPNLRYCFLFLDFISCAVLLERMHVPPSSYFVIRPSTISYNRVIRGRSPVSFQITGCFHPALSSESRIERAVSEPL